MANCSFLLKLSLESIGVTRIIVKLVVNGNMFWIFADRKQSERTFHLHPAFAALLNLPLSDHKMIGDITELPHLKSAEEIKVYALIQDLPIQTERAVTCFSKVIANSFNLLNKPMRPTQHLELSQEYFDNPASVEDPAKRFLSSRDRLIKNWYHRAYVPGRFNSNFYKVQDSPEILHKLFDKFRTSTIPSREFLQERKEVIIRNEAQRRLGSTTKLNPWTL